jgi:hypothetical protein
MSKNTFFNTRFWQDSFTSDLDPVEKLLFIYCITSPYLSLTGIYEIPLKFIAMETGLDKEMVTKILNRFEEKKKVLYREGWLCVLNYPKYQSFKGEKLEIALEREIKAVPKDILDEFIEKGYPIDTLSIQSRDMDKDMDKEIEKRTPKETPLKNKKEYLLNIPDEDIREFTNRFDASEKGIRSKGEDLDNWCEANGKRKKDYRKFLLVALKKDFPEKSEEQRAKRIMVPKLNPDGSPVMGPNGIVMVEK